MAIDKSDYEYTVVDGDSLTRIAEKHGLTPVTDWARKIWEDSNNTWMHTESDKYGKKAKRQIHIGNNKYAVYDPSLYGLGYIGYEDPHQIILYAGEKIWIPKTELTDRIIHEMTDDDLINGFRPEHGKRYRLIFPAMKVRLEMEAGTYSENEKYTLYGHDDKGELIYKKSLVVKDDGEDNNGIKELVFSATPKCLKYTLEVTLPADAKNKDGKVEVITGITYNGNI